MERNGHTPITSLVLVTSAGRILLIGDPEQPEHRWRLPDVPPPGRIADAVSRVRALFDGELNGLHPLLGLEADGVWVAHILGHQLRTWRCDGLRLRAASLTVTELADLQLDPPSAHETILAACTSRRPMDQLLTAGLPRPSSHAAALTDWA